MGPTLKGHIAFLETARSARVDEDLVHGQLRLPPLVESAAALAIDVMTKLRAIKRNYIRVRMGDVHLYRDQLLTTVVQETRGVMLVELDDQGTALRTMVFPRGEAYPPGSFVSWEWDPARVFREEAWYRDDPTTKRGALAWSSSAAFVGRPYPAQWGLGYRFLRADVGLG